MALATMNHRYEATTMKPNTASRTAQYMALFRAIETARPADKRLFNDPLAINFLDARLRLVTKLSSVPVVGYFIPKLIHKKGPGALSSGIARTKYIDDRLERTIQEGVKQVILLGAGFDTRSLRLDFLKSTTVIEIDHPDTARFKLQKLKSSIKTLPQNVFTYPVDFNKQTFDEIAVACDIHFDLPTTILWEGVTNYLTARAIDSTLQFTQRFTRGINLIFTYIDKRVLDHPEDFIGTEKLFKNLQDNEEKWTFGFMPDDLPNYLKPFGLTLLEDMNATDYRNMYMPERTDIAVGYEFYRAAFAKR